MKNMDFTKGNLLMNKVNVYLFVPRAMVLNGVRRHVDGTAIVAINHGRRN